VRVVPLTLMLLLTSVAIDRPAHAQTQTSPSPPIGASAATSSQRSSSASGSLVSVSTEPLSPYLRGIPTGTATAQPLSLTVLDAIERALKQNLGTVLADQRVTEAGGTVKRALSELLPNASGRLTASRQKVNLEAFGFPLPAGIPPVVGPFNVYDARLFASQSIFDLYAINSHRAETHNLEAARLEYKSARDLVVRVAADTYALTLAASALVDAARAQLETAQALHQQASDLKQSGLVAGIDVLRAEVQLDTTRQRLTAAQNEFDKSKLQLARLIGLPIGQPFTLADQMRSVTYPDITLEAALDRAYQSRADYQAALARVAAAEANRKAIVGEALPSVHLTADVGEIGLTPGGARGTFNITGEVNVPIFQGGRTKGRLIEADAELQTRRTQLEDLKAGIYYEVRTAFLDLQAGQEQLRVASRSRELAAAQLQQSRDRFAAGVAGNLEVVQAQETVALSSDQYISAMFASNLATGNLVRALGIAEEAARQLLGGPR
jgi:outer membrane protein TolC